MDQLVRQIIMPNFEAYFSKVNKQCYSIWQIYDLLHIVNIFITFLLKIFFTSSIEYDLFCPSFLRRDGSVTLLMRFTSKESRIAWNIPFFNKNCSVRTKRSKQSVINAWEILKLYELTAFVSVNNPVNCYQASALLSLKKTCLTFLIANLQYKDQKV